MVKQVGVLTFIRKKVKAEHFLNYVKACMQIQELEKEHQVIKFTNNKIIAATVDKTKNLSKTFTILDDFK
jgi:hypothetical protein